MELALGTLSGTRDQIAAKLKTELRQLEAGWVGEAKARGWHIHSAFIGSTAFSTHAHKLSGLTIGKGDLMCRIYRKDWELRKQDEDKRGAEHARWIKAGWDGDSRCVCKACRTLMKQRPHDGRGRPVTRVEFQVRGEAVAEFGLRNISQIVDTETGEIMTDPKTGKNLTLADRVDALWQSCIRWCRLVTPENSRNGRPLPVTRLKPNKKWLLLHDLRFERKTKDPAKPIRRVRMRGTCPTAQPLGCGISTLAARGFLRRPIDMRDLPLLSEEEAEARLRRLVGGIYSRLSSETLKDLKIRHRTWKAAHEHVLVHVNARIGLWWADPGAWTPTPPPDGSRLGPRVHKPRHPFREDRRRAAAGGGDTS